MGLIYLIHLEEKLSHSQHYLGYAESSIKRRFARHKSGQGSRFLRAANQAGIQYAVVRTWGDVTRNDERKMKNRRNHKFLCPLCKDAAQKTKSQKAAERKAAQAVKPHETAGQGGQT